MRKPWVKVSVLSMISSRSSASAQFTTLDSAWCQFLFLSGCPIRCLSLTFDEGFEGVLRGENLFDMSYLSLLIVKGTKIVAKRQMVSGARALPE